jgi:hypothetical protein
VSLFSVVILQSSFICKGYRYTDGLRAYADFQVAGSEYGPVAGSCQHVMMTQNTQRPKNFLLSASVGGTVLHGIGLLIRARNLGTRFTFLISFGHNHNHSTPNTLEK